MSEIVGYPDLSDDSGLVLISDFDAYVLAMRAAGGAGVNDVIAGRTVDGWPTRDAAAPEEDE